MAMSREVLLPDALDGFDARPGELRGVSTAVCDKLNHAADEALFPGGDVARAQQRFELLDLGRDAGHRGSACFPRFSRRGLPRSTLKASRIRAPIDLGLRCFLSVCVMFTPG